MSQPTPDVPPTPPAPLTLPTLYTPRLILRPFTMKDASRVQELASNKRIAATTASIPHPYPDGAAEQHLATHAALIAEGKVFPFAITLAGTRTPNREHDLADTGHLIGTISLHPSKPEHAHATLGYWIGAPYWNKGFATEAGRAILKFAFLRLRLHRVYAEHFTNNPASGRVMLKLGMTLEGTLRHHFNKWGEFLDVACYGILAHEWEARMQKQSALKPATLGTPISRLTPV